ncbi:rab11 family-interacting protein 3 isoform X1 [Brienomyrus brachyistius]|uniref:rab11 family-interacting protein 3 isoform X1 n=1 Tax=Brienomyrus brachyistius TaxID=42636 RepID=UPI0020B2397E|nr:rab11 family-interacting protein 3 isoform X1 [Brienomyrus brachyistius]
MEQVLLSSPGGHSEWELEQKPTLGFLLLDPDKESLSNRSNKSPDSGLDFRESEKDLVSFSLDEILQDNALKLNDLFQNSRYSSVDQLLSWEKGPECPVLQWDNHSSQSPNCPHKEPAEVMNFPIAAVERNFDDASPVHVFSSTLECRQEDILVQELDLDQNAQNIHSTPDELIDFRDIPSQSPVFSKTLDCKWEDLSFLDASLYPENESPTSCSPPPNEVHVGDKEDLSVLSQYEESVLTLASQGEERVSCETGDKGLPFELRMDPLTPSNAIQVGSPESRVSSPSHVTSPSDCHKPSGLCKSSTLLHNEEGIDVYLEAYEQQTCENVISDLEKAVNEQDISVDAVAVCLSGEHGAEVDPSFLLCSLSTGPQVTSLSHNGDVSHTGDPLSQGQDQDVSRDLMAEEVAVGLMVQQVNKESILDLSSTVGSMHDIKSNEDSKVPEGPVEEILSDRDISKDAVFQRQGSPDDLAQETYGSAPVSVRTSEKTIERLSLPEVGTSTCLPVRGGMLPSEEDMLPLKAVFNALDQDGDGFVRIEEFVQFATVYGAEQVKDLTRFLDPSGLGVISFEDFYRGISAISNGGECSEAPLYTVAFSHEEEGRGCCEEYDDGTAFEQNEVTDSAYLGSESTYSECETFTDEDTGTLVHPELHEEVETDSAIDTALHDPEDAGNSLSLCSELNNHSLVTVISGEEEHFEDFGESNDSELLLEAPDGMEGECTPGSQGRNSTLLLSPSADPFPSSFQSFLREEVLDFYCSQCHKQISRLEDLSTRLNYLEMNSTSKRLSSKKVARHLLQSSTLAAGSMDDLSRDIPEMADTDIADKVLFLERRVSELEKDSTANIEVHTRLRQDNLQLVHRANALEEQLKDQEARAEESLQLEMRRQKEAICKLERERGMELENLQARLQQLDEENSELRSCVPCLRANIERLEEEKRKLLDEVENVAYRLSEEMESRRKMSDKLSHECHKHQKEKECTQELIEDLRKQLEHLQLYKLEVEARTGRSPSAGLQEYQSRTREAELEQEIRRLKQENRSLKEQNDELNGQIINLSIQGAKNLFSASFSESLAAEINSVSRDELMEAIQKQEEINYRLQDYIDRIIVAIMESNPSILEVK